MPCLDSTTNLFSNLFIVPILIEILTDDRNFAFHLCEEIKSGGERVIDPESGFSDLTFILSFSQFS